MKLGMITVFTMLFAMLFVIFAIEARQSLSTNHCV